MKGNLTQRSQAGFTLVELAIVMIIIGLLIAGVLKGQELIANAQVTSTVAQTKAMDAATSTFRDTFNALPGDIQNPTTRLPNCTAATVCGSAGNGNGSLSNAPGQTPLNQEGERFFVHLNAANLLSGVVPTTSSAALGSNFPAAKISGNGFQVGSPTGVVGTDFPALLGGNVPAPGIYLALTRTIGLQANGTTGLQPSQALRIDTKLDDSDPASGDVRGFGSNAATGCGTNPAAGAAGSYTTSNTAAVCGLYIKVQN
ncbi:hypothetical protein RHECNPAF_178002 [Rhizobium etli CNPAF512]|nr:hypothetical protein RHECNPAF_178002 [Rhizobium etli CNPAF512]